MKFTIVVEITNPILLAKDFEAATMEEAKELAVEEAWAWSPENGWFEYDQPDCAGLCEIRDELCGPAEEIP